MSLLDRLVTIWSREHPEETLALAPSAGLSRRGFLKLLSASAAVAAAAPLVDLERLLWVPGQTVAVSDGYLLVDARWLTFETLRLLKNKLAIAASFDRTYEQQFFVREGTAMDMRPIGHALLGDTVRINGAPTVITDQCRVDVWTPPLETRDACRERLLHPAMTQLAADLRAKGLTPAQPAPVLMLPGIQTCYTALDGRTAMGVRYTELYDLQAEQTVQSFDVMATR